MRTHYPRTPHLPWSPGVAADDVLAGGLAGLRGREVVVTEKLDGENTTLYADGLHARSPDSAHHPSRTWVKALQGRIGPHIPAGWRVCGENMQARHSLAYDDLDSWFYGFSVWDAAGRCLDWDATVRFLRRLGVPVPRVLWRGVYDERALRRLAAGWDTARREGYVVRSVEGFGAREFGERVAKWVRPGHVQTDTHWMHAAVVENGLGPAAPLWAVRSGGGAQAAALLAAAGLAEGDRVPPEAEAVAADAAARLDVLGRTGDARLAGVLAAALHGRRRSWAVPRLAARLGMRQARRVGDLVGLHPLLHQPYPDAERAGGLVRMAAAADLGVLHAVAGAVLAGRDGAAADRAREQVEWSALHAEDAGLLGEAPLEDLRAGLRAALGARAGADAADRCWAQARELCARGRVVSVEEAVAATWRWRDGDFPRLVHLVGPSGSGKSTFAAGLPGVDVTVSLDELRLARGSRADQSANSAVLRDGLARLDAALARGGTVVWDATSLTGRQRSAVQAVARRRDALVTHAVVLAGEEELARRNAARQHPVPRDVLAGQLRRFDPPYPGQAHRVWYVGASGTVEDVAGAASPDACRYGAGTGAYAAVGGEGV
ncbi:RNA ligase family protein [Actinacidiphila epipremni]|uniref:AAA family ATPase n=1 Tax=Actinacidiphila epipremni TaxID=2053013 RepID=A0ABX0ZMS1_9ACTN|nr:RNA ligase family protein [Actinacidiphila epipremni]NJP43539.1 AAA family ATPase [Actinacidiphila epipremni]